MEEGRPSGQGPGWTHDLRSATMEDTGTKRGTALTPRRDWVRSVVGDRDPYLDRTYYELPFQVDPNRQ